MSRRGSACLNWFIGLLILVLSLCGCDDTDSSDVAGLAIYLELESVNAMPTLDREATNWVHETLSGEDPVGATCRHKFADLTNPSPHVDDIGIVVSPDYWNQGFSYTNRDNLPRFVFKDQEIGFMQDWRNPGSIQPTFSMMAAEYWGYFDKSQDYATVDDTWTLGITYQIPSSCTSPECDFYQKRFECGRFDDDWPVSVVFCQAIQDAVSDLIIWSSDNSCGLGGVLTYDELVKTIVAHELTHALNIHTHDLVNPPFGVHDQDTTCVMNTKFRDWVVNTADCEDRKRVILTKVYSRCIGPIEHDWGCKYNDLVSVSQ